jgi:hypothetical protein
MRLFSVTRVIAMLSLYLYLDQYDMHRAQQLKHARGRMEKAERLTRAAVYGEKLYAARTWFLHIFMLGLRRFFIGSESSKEANQEKQPSGSRKNLSSLGRRSSRSANRWARDLTSAAAFCYRPWRAAGQRSALR